MLNHKAHQTQCKKQNNKKHALKKKKTTQRETTPKPVEICSKDSNPKVSFQDHFSSQGYFSKDSHPESEQVTLLSAAASGPVPNQS